MPEFLWHERLINSTLGLPQQLLLRTGRAAKESDGFGDFFSRLFSERGLADAANIPLFGFLDKNREDVTFDEVPELFGIKNAGFGKKLLLNLITDPLLLTGSSLTKGAIAAGRIGKVERALGPDILKGLNKLSVGEAIPAMREGINAAQAGGKLKGKALTRAIGQVNRLEKEADGLGILGKTVEEVRDVAGQTSPVFGALALVGSSKLGIRIPTQHSGWFTMVGAKAFDNGLSKGMGRAYNNLAGRSHPLLKASMDFTVRAGVGGLAGSLVDAAPLGAAIGGFAGRPIAAGTRAFSKGLRSSGASRFTNEAGEIVDGDLKDLALARGHGDVNGAVKWANDHVQHQDRVWNRLLRNPRLKDKPGTLFSEWRARVGRLERGIGFKGVGRTPEDTLRLMLTPSIGPAKTAKAQRGLKSKMKGIWDAQRKAAGLPEKELNIENIRNFAVELAGEREVAGQILKSVDIQRVAGARFDPEAFAKSPYMFEKGEAVGALLRKSFITPGRFDEMKQTYDKVRKMRNALGSSNDQLNALLSNAIRGIAKGTHQTEDEVTDAFSVAAQLVMHGDELDITGQLGDLATMDSGAARMFIERNLPDLLKRSVDARRFIDKQEGALTKLIQKGLDAAGVPSTKSIKKLGDKVSIDEATPFGRMRAAEGELKNWMKKASEQLHDEGRITKSPQKILLGFKEASDAFNGEITKELFAKAGDVGDAYMEAIAQMQGKHLEFARAYDAVGASNPLAMFPRVITNAEAGRVRGIVGAGIEDSELSRLVGPLRATKARKADNVTVQTLNEIIERVRRLDLERGGDPAVKEVYEKLVEMTPETRYKFSHKPHVGLLASMGGFQKIQSIEEAVDGFVAKGLKSDTAEMMAGELVGWGERQHIHGVSPKLKAKKDAVAGELAASLDTTPDRWVIVRDGAGKEHRVSLNAAENEQMLIVAGEGETVGKAAAQELAKTGKLQTVIGSATEGASLNGHIGKQVMISNPNTATALTESLSLAHDTAGSVLRTVDSIHAMLKANATVVRPDFAVFNALSSVPMLHMNGASMRSIFGGYRDLAAFISIDPQYTDALSRLGRLEGDKVGWFTSIGVGVGLGAVSGAIIGDTLASGAAIGGGLGAVAGPAIAAAARPMQRLARQARLAGGLGEVRPASQSVYEINGAQIDIPEIMKIAGEEGLVSGMTSEILGVGRETRATIRTGEGTKKLGDVLKDLNKNGWYKGAGELRTKAREFLGLIGESPEVAMRFAGAFAFMRQGYSPRNAIRASLEALIDYADLTPTEQKIKRWISFYSFPRKMIPMTGRFINRDPAKFAAQVKTLYNLPGSETELGALVVRPEGIGLGDYRANIQRALPQLDVLSASAWLMDSLFDWREVVGTAENVGQNSFRLGIPASIMGEATFGGGKQSIGKILRETFRSSYTTRWALEQKQDPLAVTTNGDRFFGHIFGVKKASQALRQKWLLGQRAFIEADIKGRLREVDNAEDAEALSQELARIQESTARLLNR